MLVIADNEGINKWLAENPLILGGAALVLGLILVGIGVLALVTGKAPVKKGPDLEGGQAKAMGYVWLGFGALCLLFGLFKIVTGLG
jgi:hypothetical protein